MNFFSPMNLLVLIAAFLSVNAPSQNTLVSFVDKSLASPTVIEYNHSAPLDENHYASQLDGLGLHLESESSSNQETSSLNHCKSLVYRTLKSLPSATVGQLKNLRFSFDNTARRGMGGGSTIVLRCSNVTDAELVGVLVHEMGHIADTGVMQGDFFAGESEFHDGGSAIYKNDPSVEFYRLSFQDEKSLRADASTLDFVSGYAMSDAFEDFAESYTYYILHGKEFRRLTRFNKVLQKKYDFLKTRVFAGKEFVNGNAGVSYVSRDYDTTVLPYSLKKFFVI